MLPLAWVAATMLGQQCHFLMEREDACSGAYGWAIVWLGNPCRTGGDTPQAQAVQGTLQLKTCC